MTESQMIFEIVDYSRMENLKLETHKRIRKEASRKMMLSMSDKANIHMVISSSQHDYDKMKYGITTPYFAVFIGGWYCKALKKYLLDQKFHISPCGNDFDLCVSLKDNRSL